MTQRSLATMTSLAFLLLVVCIPRIRAGEFPDNWTWDDDPKQRAAHAELEGKPMPPLSVTGWVNGEVKPADMKGKVVVVDFYATWCGPCMAAIPHNNEMLKKYGSQGFMLVGVCTNKNGQEKMEQVVKDKKIEYPTARDPDLKSQKAWHVMYYPTYAVVDRKGTLRAIGLQPPNVEKVVEKLLAEKETADSGIEPAHALYASAGSTIDPAWKEGDAKHRQQVDALEGSAPPELKVQNWTNGSETTLSALKGKVVLLDFWATWCGPCIASIPHNNELQAKYAKDGLVIIGVCHTQGAENMPQTVKDKNIQYRVAADIDKQTTAAYHVDGFPDYYLIDRTGKLRLADCKNDCVEDAVKALLAEPGGTEQARGE